MMAARTESKLEDFAEDLGKMLGQAQNKAESWLGQRKAIADHLIGLRDTATQLLAQLGVSDAPRGRRRPGGPAASEQRRGPGRPKGSGKKKRTMSAEARAKIAAAQRARWARQKGQK
jgi:hypothetical protein